jgi:hypothetical protein
VAVIVTGLLKASEVMPKSDNERELIFKAYCELGQIERHHSNIQSSYRTLASTWMLAAFAGIGFVISAKEFPFDIPRELFVLAIAFAGGIGLVLLWVLDLMFYQRLLDAAFAEARQLEVTHDWLPQPRNNMRAILAGKGLQIVIWYYIALTEVMVLIVGAGLVSFLALRTRTFLDLRTGTVAVLCVITAFAWAGLMIEIAKFMKRKTSTTPDVEIKLQTVRNKRALPSGAKWSLVRYPAPRSVSCTG